jgi:hypothetical protein
MAVPADGGTPRPVSFLANAFAGTVAWSKDGKTLYFDTTQRTEPRQIARVDLQLRTPQFREDQFRDLFKEEPARPSSPGNPARGAAASDPAAADAPKSAETAMGITFDDIRRRLTLLPTGVDSTLQQISPDGKTLLLTARAAGQQNLYTFSIDEPRAIQPSRGSSRPLRAPERRAVRRGKGGLLSRARGRSPDQLESRQSGA